MWRESDIIAVTQWTRCLGADHTDSGTAVAQWTSISGPVMRTAVARWTSVSGPVHCQYG